MALCHPVSRGRVAIFAVTATCIHAPSDASSARDRHAGDSADDGRLGLLDTTTGPAGRTRSALAASEPAWAGQARPAIPRASSARLGPEDDGHVVEVAPARLKRPLADPVLAAQLVVVTQDLGRDNH